MTFTVIAFVALIGLIAGVLYKKKVDEKRKAALAYEEAEVEKRKAALAKSHP